jgi:hypothetical protein
MRWCATMAALIIFVTTAGVRAEAARFRPLAVFVDSGEAPLAAYQIELVVSGAEAKIVGVEGGDPRAFREPPYYDPAALRGGRIILAAFSTDPDLPRGRTRVATVHVQESGTGSPRYEVRLIVSATAGGKRIPASVEVVPQ